MKDAGEPAEPSGSLPPAMAEALAAFERHLRFERSLSPRTVRAYAGDIRSLLAYASGQGVDAPEGLGVTELRGWLAILHESGGSARLPASFMGPVCTQDRGESRKVQVTR